MGGADVQWLMSFAGKYPVVDIIAVFFAQYIGYIVLVLFGIALLLQSDVRRRLYLMSVSALSLLLALGVVRESLNHFFYRPRPFVAYNITPLFEHPATASFPSGHATLFFTVATLIFLFLSRRWGIWAYVVAGLIGIARVYAGVHYPLDIIGGALIGIASVFIIRACVPRPVNREPIISENV